jgi:hypothetical protein
MSSPNLPNHAVDVNVLIDLWPKRLPNKYTITLITDIKYHIVPVDNGLVEVRYANVGLDEDVGTLWRTLPSSYEAQLDVMFYRLELLGRYATKSTLGKDEWTDIKMSLGHLDAMLDKAFDQVKLAGDELDRDWRSTVLDAWGVVEHVVGRHDPILIRNHFDDNPDHLDQDAQNLGKPPLV